MELPKSEFRDGLEQIEFSSISEVATIAMTKGLGRTTRGIEYGDNTAFNRVNESWSNGKSAPLILAMLENCPQNLIDRVEELRGTISSFIEVPQKNRRRRKTQLDAGDELCPIAWVQRNPDGWSEMRKEQHPKKVIKIGVNLVTPAYFDSDKLIYRGAAAVAMADVLEQMGHQVEITAFWAVSDLWFDSRGVKHVIKCVVKASDAPMNSSSLTVALAEIGFSRVVMMPAIARATQRTPTGGMGRCINLSVGDKTGLDMIIDQNVVTLEQAVDAVKSAMKNVTAELEVPEWSK